MERGTHNEKWMRFALCVTRYAKMIYDPEANILSWEVARDPIDSAKEVGNFIVHFSKAGKPVLIEMLDASKFMGQFDKIRKQVKIEPIAPVSGI